MKIAIVSDAVYPFNKGGKETRIHEVSRRLVKEGHEVFVYTMKWWKGDDLILRDGVHLCGVCRLLPLYFERRRSILEAVYFGFFAFFALLKGNFDLIEADEFPYFHCVCSKIVSIIKNAPLVVFWWEVWDKYWFEYLGHTLGFFGYLIERFASRLPDHIISSSKATMNDLMKIGVDEKKISVIPAGIDVSKMRKVSARRDNKKVVFVGRLIEHKHVDWIIRAMPLVLQKVSGAYFTIVGDGPEREELMRLATELNLTSYVNFSGAISHEETLFDIKSSKMLILPSTREGQGIVVQEAMALGVAVIALDSERSAVREFVKHEHNGILVKSNDINELASQIVYLLNDENKHSALTENALHDVLNFDWNVIIKKTEYVYSELISQKNSFDEMRALFPHGIQ